MVKNLEDFERRIRATAEAHPKKNLRLSVVVDEGRLSNKDARNAAERIIKLHHDLEDRIGKGRLLGQSGVDGGVAKETRKVISQARGRTLGRTTRRNQARQLSAFAKSLEELTK